jgi:hypothetical protein
MVSGAAQTIKYADIIDNATDIMKHDPQFARVYCREKEDLLVVMTRGNSALYTRAVKTIETCLKKLDGRK